MVELDVAHILKGKKGFGQVNITFMASVCQNEVVVFFSKIAVNSQVTNNYNSLN